MTGTERQVNKIKENMVDIINHWIIDIKDNGEIKVKYTSMKCNDAINEFLIDYIDRTKNNSEWYISKRGLSNLLVPVTDFIQDLFDEICENEDEMKKIISILEG